MLTDKERELCLRWKETEGIAGKIAGIPCKEFSCENCIINKTYKINGYTSCNYTTGYKIAIKLLNEDKKERNSNMSEQLTITKEKVLEAAAKCSTAKEVLKTIFPEVFVEDKSINLSPINKGWGKSLFTWEQIEKMNVGGPFICVRNDKEYALKAFALTSGSYNWELKYDSQKCLCLIPTRK
jgi:hypothetical protein